MADWFQCGERRQLSEVLELEHCCRQSKIAAIAVLLALLVTNSADISANESNLAQELANPISSLISIPFQLNYDRGLGTDKQGKRWLLNFQPVMPISFTKDWNLIMRIILPIIWMEDFPTRGNFDGTGDILWSFFLSPKKPVSGLIVGFGPAILLPSASDPALGSEKAGIGPTFVVLRQHSGWTVGILANHIWSVSSGYSTSNRINSTFVQPFISYAHGTWSATINSESTYDHLTNKAAVPINTVVARVFNLGELKFQLGAGPRFWTTTNNTSPKGWGARFFIVLLFPA